eukprot:3564159-Alexandrium_andersonii.AAC.1
MCIRDRPPPSSSDAPPQDLAPNFGCGICGAHFDNPKSLRAHQLVKHKMRTLSASYVRDSSCPVCGCDFGTRLRCRKHIDGGTRNRCRMRLESGEFPMLDPVEMEALLEQDKCARTAAKRKGVCPHAADQPVRRPAALDPSCG